MASGDIAALTGIEPLAPARASTLALEGGKPVRRSLLPLFRRETDEQELEALAEVLRSGQLSRSPRRERLAEQFCAYSGAPHTVVVSSGTAALHLALMALALEPGSEVIVPSLTFVATASTVLHCGAVPVFAEVDPETLCLSPESVAERVTSRTRAIVVVHFGGRVAPLGRLLELARTHGLALIEDAAHAIGAGLPGARVGSFQCAPDLDANTLEQGPPLPGDIPRLATFSLFATKNMTGGEGGLVTTPDPRLRRRLELLRGHGIESVPGLVSASGNYDVTTLGFNYNLSDLNIALALTQLPRLDEQNRRRQRLARELNARLSGIPGLKCPALTVTSRLEPTAAPDPAEADPYHVFHLYSVQLELSCVRVSRDRVLEALLAEGVQGGVYYRPIHTFAYYQQRCGTRRGDLPITERLSDALITLPFHPLLTSAELDDMAEALHKVLIAYRA